MGKSSEVVKAIYAAFGKSDVPAVLGSFDHQIEWREAENWPRSDHVSLTPLNFDR